MDSTFPYFIQVIWFGVSFVGEGDIVGVIIVVNVIVILNIIVVIVDIADMTVINIVSIIVVVIAVDIYATTKFFVLFCMSFATIIMCSSYTIKYCHLSHP